MRRNDFAIQTRAKCNSINKCLSEEILKSGNLSYRVHYNFPQWPEPFSGYQVCGTYCDNTYLYVTTRCTECPVAVFDLTGQFIKVLGEKLPLGRAHGIFKDDKGQLLLADDGAHVIYCLNDEGEVLSKIGTYMQPSDTGFDERVEGHLAYLTVKKRGLPFNKPTRMIQAKNGKYYASDGYGNAAVHCFDENFHLLYSWGTPGVKESEFSIVHSVISDCRNRIFVADRDNDRVQIFDENGLYVNQLNEMIYPCDIVTDSDYIYVAENDGRISIFTLDLELVAQLGHSASGLRSHSIAIDQTGNLYLGLLHGNYNLVKLEKL